MSIKAIGDALRFWWLFTASADGAIKSGLTVSVSVYKNTSAVAIATGNATELGTTGLYYFDVAANLVDAVGEYIAVASTTDATVTSKALAALYNVTARAGYLDAAITSRPAAADYTQARAAKLDNLDAAISTRSILSTGDIPTVSQIATAVWDRLTSALTTVGSVGKLLVDHVAAYTSARAAKLDQIGAASVTISAPVASNSNVTIIRGDDYSNADGRALDWTLTNAPTMTGASIVVNVQLSSSSFVPYTGSVVSGTQVRLELTSAQTGALAKGSYAYDIQATLPGGHIITVVRGTWIVESDVR